MLKTVLIDDEVDAINVLSELLVKFTSIPIKVVGTANNLDDGIEIIKSTKPDVVFLDIDMPNKSGLDIYDYFDNPDFKVIFVTAYNEYAIEALKKNASDYLLKPTSFVDLQEALNKVTKEIEKSQKQNEIEDKASLLTSAEMEGKNVVFEIQGGFIMENTRNIEYCYAKQSYSKMVTYLGKEITVTKPLKALQEILPLNHFYRTHKSYLVNIHYIRKFVKGSESYVLLKSGIKIPVSVRTSLIITKEIKKMLEN